MDALSFYNKFMSEVREDKMIDGKPLFEIYKRDAEFTPVIMKIINQIIESAGYESQNEYFRIDAVGWVSHYKDMENDPDYKKVRLNAHLWDLKIAVEHENSKTDWTDEVMKLIHIKCPLKVVIGYNYANDKRDIDDLCKLEFVAKWMKEVDAFRIGTDEEYLVILGNGYNRENGLSDYKDFGYVGYLYDWNEKKFKKIEYSVIG